MVLKSRAFVESLVRFLTSQIAEKHIEYLIPVESKGALLVDLALEEMPENQGRPQVVYRRSLEYLSPEVRRTAVFGVFDDFVFSGSTIGAALDAMSGLGIPRAHIHPMAFFKFARPGSNEDVRSDVVASTVVPGDGKLLRLSLEEILRDVQALAIEHKIPASYDNLDWDVSLPPKDYVRLMRELAETGWFLYYGQREKLDASALLIPPDSGTLFSALPKIRFWYDSSKELLVMTPISFAEAGKGRFARHCPKLRSILTPEDATQRQRKFAAYQSEAISEQIALLGYVKPYLTKYGLSPRLNQKHIVRYFGPRASLVVEYLEEGYRNTPEISLAASPRGIARRLDFYWVAVEIMRTLGKEYWTQPPPRRFSRGFTVKQLIDRFAASSCVEAVHAAIDYCADMNLIATFFGWDGPKPYRAFRLTENGEMEVGRSDGVYRRKLPFFEKLGALILSKKANHEAYWWILEKVPAILMRRLGFRFPQMEVAVGYFGDITKLRPTETIEHFLTWPRYGTDMWQITPERGASPGSEAKVFSLSAERYTDYQSDILEDPEIIRVIGPTEIVMELISSRTMGHHVAILLDISSDGRGGATYLSNSLRKATGLIEHRNVLARTEEKRKVSHQIDEWLKGFDEKTKLLVEKRKKKLFAHMDRTVKRLVRQRRGDIATRLTQDVFLPDGNRIIPAFKDLSLVVRRLDGAMRRRNMAELSEISQRVVMRRTTTPEGEDLETLFSGVRHAIDSWTIALAGEMQDDSVYNAARLNIDVGESFQMFIVAYDLIGSSGARYAGRIGADRDRRIQSIISNWFIAFGGHAQRAEFGGGDLGFGFFHSAVPALQATFWAGYHLNLLKRTDNLLKQDKPHAGFGIVKDELRSGFMEQVRSGWLSRVAKAWKREAERIADSTGRDGRPIVAMHADLLSGVREVPHAWLGDNAELDGIPVRFVRSDAISVLPWVSNV